MAAPNAPRPRGSAPAATEMESTHVPAAPAMDETNISATGGDLEATAVPNRVSSPGKSQTGRSASGVPGSSRAPAEGMPIGPQGRAQIGDYRLIKKLGQGGMGEVFLAHQITLDRQAALKVLAKHLADKPDFVKRFYREARAMAKIDHPQTVRVFAVDEDDGIHYVAMEFIDGKSLQGWMEQLGRFSVGDAVHVTLRCAEALQQAHQMNMVHRDIKPDNIMLTSRGQVKVADFGLAKALDDEEMSMTQSGTGLGTPYYMAPEQARNAKHVDGRSDIYALGITLYHFLTGKLPFGGNSAMEVVLAKEQGRFVSARKLNPEVPERLDLIIDKMIAKEPSQRFQNFGEVIRLLSGLGLESPSLSFIDSPDKGNAPAPVTATSRTVPTLNRSTAASMPPATSAKLAQTQSARGTPTAAAARTQVSEPLETQWQVEFRKPDGEKTVVRWGTSQVLTALRSGNIDNRAKVKKDAAAAFMPIAQFPEFATTVQGLLLKKSADKKATKTKKFLLHYRWHELLYAIKKWLWGLFSSVMGIVSFLLYLAILAGIGYGAYWYWTQYGTQHLNQAKQAIQNAQPAQPAPSTPAAPAAQPPAP